MDNIINTLIDTNMIYGYTKVVCKQVFNLLNGKINPTVRARQIVFSVPRDTTHITINDALIINGSSVPGAIFINIDMIREINQILIECGRCPLSEPEAAGFILGTVAHELSHCEQLCDMRTTFRGEKSIEEKYDEVINGKKTLSTYNNLTLTIEVPNELNTINWLQDNEKYIRKEFRNYNLDLYIQTSTYLYLNSKLPNPFTIKDYRPHKNVYSAFNSLFGSIMGIHDPDELFQYTKTIGIDKFILMHNITNRPNVNSYKIKRYLFDPDSLRENTTLANTFLDILLEEILITRSLFITGIETYSVDKSNDTLSFAISSYYGKKKYAESFYPNNLSPLFIVWRTYSKYLDKGIVKFLIDNPIEVENFNEIGLWY